MTLQHKWLTGIGASLAGLGVVAALLYWLLVPAYVERALKGALQERGLSAASFSLESVSLSALKIRNLRLDETQTLTVSRLEVDYDLAGLFNGRVNEVRIFDATLLVRLSSDYEVDWGPVEKLIGSGKKTGPPPLRDLRWINSRLIVETPIRTIRLPLRGSMKVLEHESRMSLHSKLFNESIHIHGSAQINPGGKLQSGELLGAMASGGPDRLSVELRFQRFEGKEELSLGVRGQRRSLSLEEQGLTLADLVGSLKLRVSGEKIVQASGKLSASSAIATDLQVVAPRIELERESGLLAFKASGRVDQLDATLRGELGPHPRHWTYAGPFDTTWEFQGDLPPRLSSWLDDTGIIARGLRITQASGRAQIKRTEAGWRAKISRAQASVAAASLRVPATRLSIIRPRASIHFGAIVDSHGGEIALRKESQAKADSIRWRSVSLGRSTRTSPVVTLAVREKSALLFWDRESHQVTAEKLAMNLRTNIQISDEAKVQNLRAWLTLSLVDRGAGPEMRILASRLWATRLELGSYLIPALSARIRGRPKYLRIEASSRLTKAATLSIETKIDQRRQQRRCPTRVALPDARIETDDPLAALIRRLVPVSVSGNLDLKAQIDPCSPSLASEGTVRLTNLTARDLDGKAALFGINGSITLSGLRPITTRGRQEIRWKRTKLGKRSFGKGSLVFQSHSPGVVEVLQSSLNLGGGVLRTAPFLLNPKELDIETTIFAEGISLRRWLPVVSRARARGSGKFSGQLSGRLRWRPEMQLELTGGHLRAKGPGHFAIQDQEWLHSALERYASGFGTGGDKSDLIKDRLIGALLDFGYKSLRVSIIQGRPPVLRIETQGKGRQIPQELDLTLNVTGFQDLINPGLRAWLNN